MKSKICISFFIIYTLALIILSILGNINRIGYISDFNLDINRTLELNNLLDIKESYIKDDKLDEESLKNYIVTNENIKEYIYDFRVRYYSKVFRNSDIYGVYVDINKILKDNNFIKKININDNGSPFGNLISTKIIDFEKIDNVNYKLKIPMVYIYMFVLILYLLLYTTLNFKCNQIGNILNVINRNKKIIFISYFIFISIILISIIAFYIYGNIERKIKISDLTLNIDKTLIVNNLYDEMKNQDFNTVSNYILTNENISKYRYNFVLNFDNNNFIYDIIPTLKDLPDSVEKIDMDYNGNITSSRKLSDIKEIVCLLEIKPIIYFILFFIIISYLVLFTYFKFNEICNKYDILYSYLLLTIIFVIMFFIFKLYNLSFGKPIFYLKDDDLQFLTIASGIIKELWFPIPTDKLGYPFGAYIGTYPMLLLMNFEILKMKILSIFLRDPIDLLNVSYLIIFPIAGIISFYVMRNLKISRFISIFGSLAFTFIQYVFIRNTMHYNYSVIYFIPLTILLCIWLYEDDNILKINKTFFKNKRNIIAIVIMLLIANNGGGYYIFFSCFLICVSAMIKLFKKKDIKLMLPFIYSIFILCSIFIINLSPGIIYQKINHINQEIWRDFTESELYALNISNLILNIKYFNWYYNVSKAVGDHAAAYLGIIGISGFVLLLLILITKRNNSRLSFLSELNIFSVLYGTVSGFSIIFALFVTDMIRTPNRISIYIAYICILSFCIFIDKIKNRNIYYYIILSMILTISLADQIYPKKYYNNEEYIKNCYSDREYVKSIENIMDKNSAVYQIPTFTLSPVYPKPYRPIIGYIFSKDLKWSFGVDKDRKENEWFYEVEKLPAEDFLKEIHKNGFSGVSIHREYFDDSEYIKICNDIENILKEKPIISEENDLAFFTLKNLNKID